MKSLYEFGSVPTFRGLQRDPVFEKRAILRRDCGNLSVNVYSVSNRYQVAVESISKSQPRNSMVISLTLRTIAPLLLAVNATYPET